MKQVIFFKAALPVVLLCMSIYCHAQYEFGISFGSSVYQGDLTPEKFGAFKTQKFALGLHVDRVLGHSFSVRGNILIGKLKGDDGVYSQPEYRQQRNFNFTSPLLEVSGLLVLNLTAKNYADKGLSPYVYGGAGLAFLNIKRDWTNYNRNYFDAVNHTISDGITLDSLHKTPRVIPVIPLGGGLRYFFSPKWGLNAEAAYRLSYTDYLDGFSQAANPELKDHYMNYSIGVIFRPGQDKRNRLGCPVLRY